MARSILISVLLAIVSVITSSGEDNVNPPFILSHPPSPSRQYEHSGVLLMCAVNRTLVESTECPNSAGSFQWFKSTDGQEEAIKNQSALGTLLWFFNTSNEYGLGLMMKDFRKSDEGLYWCNVQCTRKQYKVEINVLLAPKPSDTSHFVLPQTHLVWWILEGKSVTLPCKLHLQPDHTLINWGWGVRTEGINDTTFIEERSPPDRIQFTTMNGTEYNKQLTINNLQESDGQTYICQVIYSTRRDGLVSAATKITLVVLADEENKIQLKTNTSHFVLRPTQLVWRIFEGKSVTLPCKLHLQPDHTVIDWGWRIVTDGRNDTTLLEDRAPSDRIQLTTINGTKYNKQLTINNVQESDEHIYACDVSYIRSLNEEVRETAKITLIVLKISTENKMGHDMSTSRFAKFGNWQSPCPKLGEVKITIKKYLSELLCPNRCH